MVREFEYNSNTFDGFQVAKGQHAFLLNLEGYAAIVDSAVTTPLINGDPVTYVDTADSGVRLVKKLEAGERLMGFVRWQIKNNTYKAHDRLEFSQKGDVLWFESDGAIANGDPVYLTNLADVLVGTTAGDLFVGFADSGCSGANQMVRVRLETPHLAA